MHTSSSGKRKYLSLRLKSMVLLTSFSVLITVYVGMTSYSLASRIIENIDSDLSKSYFSQSSEQADSFFSVVNSSLTSVIRIPEIRMFTERTDVVVSAEVIADIRRQVRDIIYLAASERQVSISFISLYFKSGYTFQSSQAPLPYADYDSAIGYFKDTGYLTDQKYAPSLWCGIIEVYGEKPERLLINVRKLYDQTANEVGLLVAGINDSSLLKPPAVPDLTTFLVDAHGIVLTATDKSLIGLPLSDADLSGIISDSDRNFHSAQYGGAGNLRSVLYKRTIANDVDIVVASDYRNSIGSMQIRDYALKCLVVAAIGIVVSSLAAVLLSRRLSAAVVELQKVIKRVYEGDISARFHFRGNDDIMYIGEKFNDMLEHFEGLFEIQDYDNKIKHDLEMRLLQSQINPHLLYNTLDSIIWALKSNDLKRGQELIALLSSFFKISLSRGSSLIPLYSEISLIENYILIQRLARDKNIELVLSIPEPLAECMIIKLSLQPLVENSIMHGFSGYRNEGRILIAAEAAADELRIVLEDNGIGLTVEECASINRIINAYPPIPGQKHFGLYNVNRRIKSLFGDRFGIQLSSELGVYTRVSVTIPSEKAEETDMV